MQIKRRVRTSLDVLNIIGSLIFIALFTVMLIQAVSFWTFVYPTNDQLSLQMYWIALIMAILTTGSQWIIGRIKSITESLSSINKSRRLKKWQKKKLNKRKK